MGQRPPWDRMVDQSLTGNDGAANSSKFDRFLLGSEGVDPGTTPVPGSPMHEWAGLVIYKGPIADIPWPVGPYTTADKTCGSQGGGDPYGPYHVFASEWDTNTGTTSEAVFDTGRTRHWNTTFLFGTTPTFEVFSSAATGRGYPTQNYIRQTIASDGTSGQAMGLFLQTDFGLSTPAVGDGITMRWYYSWRAPTADHGTEFTNHPTYWGNASDGVNNVLGMNYGWYEDFHNADRFSFSVGDTRPGFEPDEPYSPWSAMVNAPSTPDFWGTRDAIYRVELRYHGTGADTYTLRARLYDHTGAIIADEDDWQGWDGGAPWDRMVDQTLSATGGNADKFDRFLLGSEGVDPGTTPVPGSPMHEWAGLVIYKGPIDAIPWPVGPYSSAEKNWIP